MGEILFSDIDTPSLLIEASILEENLQSMQNICNSANVKLRPHIKTHKSTQIGKMQLAMGASGIACAKVTEALVFAEAGFDDIQIANIVVGEHKFKNLLKLKSLTKCVTVCVDNFDNAKILEEYFGSCNEKINVLLKVDCGYHRCGLADKFKILELSKYLTSSNVLNFKGITTHAGQAYGAKSKEELHEIAGYEASFMLDIANFLRENGVKIDEISVGSNPTARISSQYKGITEIRTGNYVFNDMIQVNLGTVSERNCALTVLTQVISIPAGDRVIIDAGSKAFSSDKGAHGNETNPYFGKIIGKDAKIVRLSEEHGIVHHKGEKFEVGERLRVIPNHACTTTNMFEKAYLVDGKKVIREIIIDVRGKIQ